VPGPWLEGGPGQEEEQRHQEEPYRRLEAEQGGWRPGRGGAASPLQPSLGTFLMLYLVIVLQREFTIYR
jgi:hypothetical protein